MHVINIITIEIAGGNVQRSAIKIKQLNVIILFPT
jgi:hypothetical protein